MGEQMELPLPPPRRNWRAAVWIPSGDLDDADRLANIYRQQGDKHSLLATWTVVEPHAVALAQEAWWRARHRVGDLVEPADLVSVAKRLFLSRLLKRWSPARGRFLRYAAVTFQVEFWKCLRRRGNEAEVTVELGAVPEAAVVDRCQQSVAAAEVRLVVEQALAPIRSDSPEVAAALEGYLTGAYGCLREAAVAHDGDKGVSKSSLHRSLQRVKNHMSQDERGENTEWSA